MVNYYELLEVSQNADKTTIEQAIRKTRRLWNNRANNPDAAIRAEAELHVKEVAQAEKILLDPIKREEYDEELSRNPIEDNSYGQPEESVDWEDEFFRAYDNEMDDYAANIALQEIHLHERNGRAWFLYGEALRRGGNLKEGIAALKRATLLINDDGVYRQLGFAYHDSGNFIEATKAFQTAYSINPGNYDYYRLSAHCLRRWGMFSEAIKEAKKAYSMNPEDEDVRFEYFAALHEDALRAMSYNRSSGKHLIINKKQLDYVNDLLKTMSVVIPKNDNYCTNAMDEIVKIVVDAENFKGGGFFSFGKPGYEYNYEISNADTRSTGIQ